MKLSFMWFYGFYNLQSFSNCSIIIKNKLTMLKKILTINIYLCVNFTYLLGFVIGISFKNEDAFTLSLIIFTMLILLPTCSVYYIYTRRHDTMQYIPFS